MQISLSSEIRPIVVASLFVAVILVAGTARTFSPTGTAPLLSVNCLLQQLQTGGVRGNVHGLSEAPLPPDAPPTQHRRSQAP